MKIYGAGIAGLLAGCIFQTAQIYEKSSEHKARHKALLRFRSAAVGDAVGIDFKKVRVHKGVWYDGEFVQPSIFLANSYSKKVVGRLADRSIWNVEPVDRYVAPSDFVEQLVDRCAPRITWGYTVTQTELKQSAEITISTLPMNIISTMVSAPGKPPFAHAEILVRRWRVVGSDVFQTVYFPQRGSSLYRASITGDLLIAEYMTTEDDASVQDEEMFSAFGLRASDCEPMEQVRQEYGKIVPINDAWRKRFIFDLTTQYSIYSLGRFGTWRNLLLDDVIHDIAVLKKLMNTTTYDRHCHYSK